MAVYFTVSEMLKRKSDLLAKDYRTSREEAELVEIDKIWNKTSSPVEQRDYRENEKKYWDSYGRKAVYGPHDHMTICK